MPQCRDAYFTPNNVGRAHKNQERRLILAVNWHVATNVFKCCDRVPLGVRMHEYMIRNRNYTALHSSVNPDRLPGAATKYCTCQAFEGNSTSKDGVVMVSNQLLVGRIVPRILNTIQSFGSALESPRTVP